MNRGVLIGAWGLFLMARMLCAAGDCPCLDAPDGCDEDSCPAGCCLPANLNPAAPRIAEPSIATQASAFCAVIPDRDVILSTDGVHVLNASIVPHFAGRPYPPSDLPLLI